MSKKCKKKVGGVERVDGSRYRKNHEIFACELFSRVGTISSRFSQWERERDTFVDQVFTKVVSQKHVFLEIHFHRESYRFTMRFSSKVFYHPLHIRLFSFVLDVHTSFTFIFVKGGKNFGRARICKVIHQALKIAGRKRARLSEEKK